MPFGPLPSLPGMIANPVFGFHSQISPVLVGSAPGCGLTRRLGLVAAKPPPASGVTELNAAVSGAMTHPIQVNVGVAGRVSISNTSIDSRNPWWTRYTVCTRSAPGLMANPWALSFSFSPGSTGPGHCE